VVGSVAPTLAGLRQGYQALEDSYQYLTEFKFKPAARAAVQSQHSLEKTRRAGEQSPTNTRVLEAATYFSSALEHAATAAPAFLELETTESLLELELALENLGLARAEIDTTPAAGLAEPHLQIRNLIAEKSADFQLALEIARATAADRPQLLGTTTPAHYLIVLQDQNELGIVLTLETGKVTELNQKEVPDPKLTGTITFDLNFVEQLLEKLGSITVDRETISSQNLASKTIEHSGDQWRTSLTKALLEKLTPPLAGSPARSICPNRRRPGVGLRFRNPRQLVFTKEYLIPRRGVFRQDLATFPDQVTTRLAVRPRLASRSKRVGSTPSRDGSRQVVVSVGKD